jgi:hypothetical protein
MSAANGLELFQHAPAPFVERAAIEGDSPLLARSSPARLGERITRDRYNRESHRHGGDDTQPSGSS